MFKVAAVVLAMFPLFAFGQNSKPIPAILLAAVNTLPDQALVTEFKREGMFPLDVKQLTELKQAGAHDSLINALAGGEPTNVGAASTNSASTNSATTVSVSVDGQNVPGQELRQNAVTGSKGILRKARAWGNPFNFDPMNAGTAYTLAGKYAAVRVTSRTPKIQIHTSGSMHYALRSMNSGKNAREMTKKDLPTMAEKTAKDTYTLTPESSLQDGQYAVVDSTDSNGGVVYPFEVAGSENTVALR